MWNIRTALLNQATHPSSQAFHLRQQHQGMLLRENMPVSLTTA